MTAAPDPVSPVDYDVPVKGVLHVVLDNGDQWPAAAADLDRFGFITRTAAYRAFSRALTDILRGAGVLAGDLTDAELNPVRDLAETAILHPDLIDHADNRDWTDVADLERRLQHLTPTRLRELAKQLTDLGRRLDEAEHAQGPAALGMGQVLAAVGRELAAMVGGPA